MTEIAARMRTGNSHARHHRRIPSTVNETPSALLFPSSSELSKLVPLLLMWSTVIKCFIFNGNLSWEANTRAVLMALLICLPFNTHPESLVKSSELSWTSSGGRVFTKLDQISLRALGVRSRYERTMSMRDSNAASRLSVRFVVKTRTPL